MYVYIYIYIYMCVCVCLVYYDYALGVGVFDPADESFELVDISAKIGGDYNHIMLYHRCIMS